MAQALEPPTAHTTGIYFELDRFELTDARRVELNGRWFGIRGRRFVRPTLTMLADGGRRRLLADIEHKPWSAEDGESWTAAFAWDVDDAAISDLELGVAPDIAVELPPPGSEPRRTEVRNHRSVEPRQRPSESEAVKTELGEARQENERLSAELERAEDAKVETTAALARRDAALSKLDELSAQLDQALQERDRVAQERDRVVGERDRVVQERDRVVGERDRALADARRAASERDRALNSRDHALGKCEQLVRSAAGLEAELDATRIAAGKAQDERRRAEMEQEQVQTSAAARSALSANVPVRRRHLTWQRPAAGGHGGERPWAGRLMALAVLLAALIALTLIARLL
jgi:hypothetical protein